MKRSEVIPAALTLIAQALPGTPVVYDDFSSQAASAMETALRNGVCVALKPILGSKRTVQTGGRVAELLECCIHLRVNSSVAAGFNTYDAQDVILEKLCGDRALAAKAGEPGGEVTQLVPEDQGCLTHALFFHVPVTNL